MLVNTFRAKVAADPLGRTSVRFSINASDQGFGRFSEMIYHLMSGRSEFRNRPRIILVLFLACGAVPSITLAQETAPAPAPESRFLPWEKGSVKVGGFLSTFNSTLTFGANNGSSASLNA